MGYRIVPHFHVSDAQLALAPARHELADAVADMGEGMIMGDARRVVAFHERHMPIVESEHRLACQRGHVWTNVQCPAYHTYRAADCECVLT